MEMEASKGTVEFRKTPPILQEAFCSSRNFVNYILQWRSILLCLDLCEIQSASVQQEKQHGSWILTISLMLNISFGSRCGNLRSSFLLASLLCPLGYSALFPYPRNLWLWTAVLPGTLAFLHLILRDPQKPRLAPRPGMGDP